MTCSTPLGLEDEQQAKKVMRGVTAAGMAALWRRGKDLTIIRTPYIDIDSETALDEAVRAVRAQRQPMKAIPQQDDTLLSSLLHADQQTSLMKAPEKAEKTAFEQTSLAGLAGLELKECKRVLIRAVLQANPAMSSNEIRDAIGGDRSMMQELVREVKAERN